MLLVGGFNAVNDAESDPTCHADPPKQRKTGIIFPQPRREQLRWPRVRKRFILASRKRVSVSAVTHAFPYSNVDTGNVRLRVYIVKCLGG